MPNETDDSVVIKMVVPDKTKTFGDSVEFNPDDTRNKLPNVPPPAKTDD